MLQASGATAGSVLLVDSVNNRTNGSVNTSEATETIRNALANHGTFFPLTVHLHGFVRHPLGLFPHVLLGTRS